MFKDVFEIYNFKNIFKKNISSTNDFYDVWLENFIKRCIFRTKKFEIKFIRIELKKPTTTPNNCRLKNLTYSGDLVGDCQLITHVENKTETKIYENIKIAKLPVMLFSSKCILTKNNLIANKECVNLIGGYFYLKGKPKIIITQEKIASNIIFTEVKKKEFITRIISKVDQKTRNLYIQIKSKRTKNLFRIFFNPLKDNVSIVIVLRLLGINNVIDVLRIFKNVDEDGEKFYATFLNYVDLNEFNLTIDQCETKLTKLLSYEKDIQIVLKVDVLPNVGEKVEHFYGKLHTICIMIIRHLKVFSGDKNYISDRDNLKLKEFQVVGELLKKLFSNCFYVFKNIVTKEVSSLFNREDWILNIEEIDLSTILTKPKITTEINFCIRSGNWKKKRYGISQNLELGNNIKEKSFSRRIIHPINTTNKQIKIRQVNPSTFGFKCPVETPEGEQCGIITHFSFLSTVSSKRDKNELMKTIKNMNTSCIGINYENEDNTINLAIFYKLFLDGCLIGFTKYKYNFVKEFKYLRRQKNIPFDVSIFFSDKEKTISIFCNDGRILKPLYINKYNEWYITESEFNELEEEGESDIEMDDDIIKKIEYIDIHEESNCLVSEDKTIDPKYTHYEVDKCSFLGLTALLIPFSDHNQSPRNSYSTNMMPQACSFPGCNLNYLYLKSMNCLNYPELRLVDTMHSRIAGVHNYPYGQNCVVLIATIDGYNIDDAIIINQSAIDRGLFSHLTFRSEEDVEKEREGLETPKKDTLNVKKKWDRHTNQNILPCITEEGLPEIGTKINYNDILIGKTAEFKDPLTKEIKKKDKSVLFPYKNGYYVESVVLTKDENDQKLAKIRVVKMFRPEIGDKFSSTHGQKGVIGITKRHEDLPYTKEGIVPDLIINPHAIPSRMTIGQLLEHLLGKKAALTGCLQDGTPFQKLDMEKTKEELNDLGFDENGNEVFYNPINGRRIKKPLFCGICYYMKLKHFSEDKLHTRRRGPRHILTRQPIQGKSRDGGLKVGEMDRFCMETHGTAKWIQEITDRSDIYEMYICSKCGLPANFNFKNELKFCNSCGVSGKITSVMVPYTYKLMLQELMAMSMTPRIITDN